ncbi:MAG: membrane-bound O-acyltransferase family protein [Micavibrio sp.]|nr:membrane-bound O-acyltransferase family protein [Micavibrio sp.]
MLFNSWIFIAFFLPVVLAGYYLLKNRNNGDYAIVFLVLASLFFYGWWDVRYVPLLLLSIVTNYVIGQKCSEGSTHNRSWLILGILLNIAALGYFKYAGFFVESINELGHDFTVPRIVLPLAISFFTFQQIAYLVDSYKGHMKQVGFKYYCLFVSFFPQLIAGPIVHHSEMLPQFIKKQKEKINWALFTGGLVVFVIGLFKKVVIADRLAEVATPIFTSASNGSVLTFFESWLGALAYTFQLYFDFSGYSDMAIGLAALFGIMLPLNFLSPYKAKNIQEFWQRWHITLSRFLRDYLYIPLGGNRHGKNRHYMAIFVTFLLGGIWHGANWTFAIWGALHGFYLIVYHAFKKIKMPKLLAWSITFLAVVVGWVFFRADSVETALYMLQSMRGDFGVALFDPQSGLGQILQSLGVDVMHSGSKILRLNDKIYLLVAAFLVAIFAPSTHEIMNKSVALSHNKLSSEIDTGRWLRFTPNARWAVFIGLLAAVALLSLTSVSEFLYFQF